MTLKSLEGLTDLNDLNDLNDLKAREPEVAGTGKENSTVPSETG